MDEILNNSVIQPVDRRDTSDVSQINFPFLKNNFLVISRKNE